MITTDLYGRSTIPAQSFLLCPENARFLAGRGRRIAGWHENLLIAAAIAALIGVVTLSIFVVKWRTWIRYRDEGATTTARIVDHRIRHGKSNTYYVTFRYQVEDATGEPRSYTSEEDVGRDLYDQLALGSTSQARYLTAQPAAAWLAWTPELPLGYPLGSFVGIAAIVLGTTFAAWKWHDLRLLGRAGHLIGGQVLACHGRRGSKGSYTVTVRYCFDTPTGQRIESEASRGRHDLKGAILPTYNTPVVVVYVSDKLYQVL